MDTINTAAQAETEDQSVVKTTLIFPAPLWKQIKIAAINADKTAQQYVIDKMAEAVGVKAA